MMKVCVGVEYTCFEQQNKPERISESSFIHISYQEALDREEQGQLHLIFLQYILWLRERYNLCQGCVLHYDENTTQVKRNSSSQLPIKDRSRSAMLLQEM